VFPACAGMNRGCRSGAARTWRVPRVRGDEPLARLLNFLKQVCSPRARG